MEDKTRVDVISKNKVESAVDALVTILKKKDKTVSLVEYPDKIDLQFTLKKITYSKRKIISLSLPHSIHHKSREVCIFVKDLDQKNREYEDTVEHYEELFKSKKVKSISKIVPIKALKTDYSELKSKRVLAQAYDLYLADACVFGTLPALLGKAFFSKKRTVPVQVDMGAPNLKNEIAKAVDGSRCVIQPSGNCHMATVAHSWMSPSEIVNNVVAAANQIAQKVHGGLVNIRNISIKSVNTMSMPLLLNLAVPGKIEIEDGKPEVLDECIDEVTTVTGGLVRIRADGHVQVLSDKKPVLARKRKLMGKRGQQEAEIKQEVEEGVPLKKGKNKNRKLNDNKKQKLDVKEEIKEEPVELHEMKSISKTNIGSIKKSFKGKKQTKPRKR